MKNEQMDIYCLLARQEYLAVPGLFVHVAVTPLVLSSTYRLPFDERVL